MFLQNIKKEILHVGNVIDELKAFVNMTDTFELIIGSDSQRKGLITIHATVLFLWNLTTRKFRLFYNKERIPHTGRIDLSVRLIEEASRSVGLAQTVIESGVMDVIGMENLIIHLDVGVNGKSKKVINTVTGMVKGMGLEYKIKPDAFVASCIADRLSK